MVPLCGAVGGPLGPVFAMFNRFFVDLRENRTETQPTFTRTRGTHVIACYMKSLRKFPHFRWTIGSCKYCQYYLFPFLQVTSLSHLYHDESRGRVLSRLSRYELWELHWARLPTLGTSDQLLGCSRSLLLPGPVCGVSDGLVRCHEWQHVTHSPSHAPLLGSEWCWGSCLLHKLE